MANIILGFESKKGEKIMENNISKQAQEIADNATRLPNDINGNPRYYVWYYAFDGERPPFATMYRGKKYGSGWVFQSYWLTLYKDH